MLKTMAVQIKCHLVQFVFLWIFAPFVHFSLAHTVFTPFDAEIIRQILVRSHTRDWCHSNVHAMDGVAILWNVALKDNESNIYTNEWYFTSLLFPVFLIAAEIIFRCKLFTSNLFLFYLSYHTLYNNYQFLRHVMFRQSKNKIKECRIISWNPLMLSLFIFTQMHEIQEYRFIFSCT